MVLTVYKTSPAPSYKPCLYLQESGPNFLWKVSSYKWPYLRNGEI